MPRLFHLDITEFLHSRPEINLNKSLISRVAEIISKPYADLTLNDVNRVVVDVQAIRKVPQPVRLAKIKRDAN